MADTSTSIDNGLFKLSDKKIKKRSLQSSLSTSSSLSSSSTNDMGNSLVCAESSSKFFGENKENVMMLDKDEMPASLFNISFKFLNTETRLLRKILIKHGLSEAAHDATDYNLLWTGNVLKPDLLRSLSSYQRINHFPR